MKIKIAIATIFIWIGCLLSISFMEAWVKFRAEGVTLPIGLSLGRLVFSVLNKMEWALCLIALFGFSSIFRYQRKIGIPFAFVIVILMLESVWLLPVLDVRAMNIINHIDVSKTKHHLYFGILEFIKLLLLAFTGIQAFKLLSPKNES